MKFDLLTVSSFAVYNSRRSNVYEAVNPHHRSLNGSMASGLTEATSSLTFKFVLLLFIGFIFSNSFKGDIRRSGHHIVSEPV